MAYRNKNNGIVTGRPPKYKTAAELQAAIDSYFESKPKAQSIAGLAVHLGFSDRRSIYDLQKKEKFSHIVKKACTSIENWWIQNAAFGETRDAVSIFILKSMGYSDRVQVEVGGIPGGEPIKSETKSIVEEILSDFRDKIKAED